MQIQVGSDKTVTLDASLARFVTGETERILDTLSTKITRVEVHLSDVNGRKGGPADKRCVVEARPAGARPMTTSAIARRLDAAIAQALRKMQRALRAYFERQGISTKPIASRVAARAKAKTKAAKSAKTAKSAKSAKSTKVTKATKGSAAAKTRPGR